MSEYKEHQKALKSPDRIQRNISSWIDWMIKYKNHLLGILSLGLILALGQTGYRFFKNRAHTQRVEALIAADLAYQKEQETWSKEQEAIYKQIEISRIGQDPNNPATKQLIDAQIKDLENKAKNSKAKHDESAKKYLEAYQSLKPHPEGLSAGMRYLAFLATEKKFSEAEAIAAEIFKNSKAYPSLYELSGLYLANLYETLAKPDLALETYEALLASGSKDLKPKIMLSQARIHLSQGTKDKGLSTIDSLLKDFASAPEADQARALKTFILE